MIPVLAVLASLSLVLTLVLHGCVRVLLRRRPVARGGQPPVTILKPLRGLDDDLYDNLASFARQRYERFQIVLGAEDPDDPALAVAHRIRQDFPQVDIDVVAGAPPFGLNPKVRNLAAMTRVAKHGLLLVSDSNVRVDSDYLCETVAAYEPGVGVVTNLFAGVEEQSLGALFENLQLCTWIAGGLAGSQVLAGRACVVGKSMLFARELLQAVGGWASVADVLAEDYVLGTMAERAGLRTVVAPYLIRTVNRRWSFAQFVNRHLRWGQIRRRLCPAAYVGEPLLHPTPWLAGLALAGAPLPAAAGLGVKIASDLLLASRLRGRAFGPAALLAIPGKDLLLAAIWLVAGFRRRIWWRGHHLVIGDGTVLSPDRRRHATNGSDWRDLVGIARS